MKKVIFLLLLLIPSQSFAAKHIYNCATEMSGGLVAATCSSASIQLQANSSNSSASTYPPSPDPYFSWVTLTPYYFVINSTGTGNFKVRISDLNFTNNDSSNIAAGTSGAQRTLTPVLVGSDTLLQVVGQPAGTSATNALITYLCVSSVSYADCAYVPPAPTLATTTPAIQGASDITFGLAFVVFLLSFPFWQWILKHFFGGVSLDKSPNV